MSFGKHLCRNVMVLMCMSLNGLEAAGTPLNDYKRALVEYYGTVNFHPLLQPEGHRVGDVIDSETLMVVLEQETCFPDLQTKPSTESNLPSIKLLENEGASFWMKLMYKLGIEIKGADQHQVLLNLEDVSVESVALGTLQDALDEECSHLRSIFESNHMAWTMGRRVNVIASILKGRANTVFSYSGNVRADAKLETLIEFLGDTAKHLKKLAPELAIKFGLSERVNIIHETKKVQTVAYRPATIFRHTQVGGLIIGGLDIEPFDPQSAVHQKRLRNLARTWADSNLVGVRANSDVGK